MPVAFTADAALASMALTSELPREDRQRLAQIARTRRYAKGQVVFADGEPCAGLFMLSEGHVKLYKLSADGREKVIHLVKPGESFAEAALFGDRRYPVSAQAMAASSILLLPREPLLHLLRAEPELSFRMLASMASRLKRFVHQAEDLTFQSAAQRLASYILGEAGFAASTTRFSMAKKDLAGHLGMTPETFSRILASLRGLRIIEVDGAEITINDVEGLRSVATGRRLSTDAST